MPGFTVSRNTVKRRVVFVFTMTVLVSVCLIGRLAWIQIVLADELYDQAWNQWNHRVFVRSERGAIYDRQGRLLAGSTDVQTVVAIPPKVEDYQMVAGALAPVLKMDEESIVDLVTLDLSAVYIKRKVDEEVSAAVQEMNLPGIELFKEEKRYYPGGNLSSQLLGFVGMDQGWSGLEFLYEQYLGSSEGRLLYPADAHGRQLPHTFYNHLLPEPNCDIYLSIDETIQHIVERELERIMVDAAPEKALAIAVDPNSGAVLAAAAKPDYDPQNFDHYDSESWSLAPFTSAFEPGSTFKLVTLAAVLEEGLFDPDEVHYCQGYTVINGQRINCWTADRGGCGQISFYQALGASCNTAFIALGQRLGADKMAHYMQGFGYGQQTGIDYPGESSGLVFNSSQLGPLELATTSFGQGISVTPVQQAMAVSAMINGGYLYEPFLVAEIKNKDGETVFRREPMLVRQVISTDTSDRLIELMETVILEGTGKQAALEGYRTAGKTGTAEKLDSDQKYSSHSFIYSFVGFAPVEEPQLVLFVAVDGVTKGPRYGSATSAPLFKRIMEDSLNYLQVTPTDAVLWLEDRSERGEKNEPEGQ
jgi:stage V sporulation protein D (sporulation-specific penicillin-binding protein)